MKRVKFLPFLIAILAISWEYPGYAQPLQTNTTSGLVQPQQPVGQQGVPVLDLENQLNTYQKNLSDGAKDYQGFLREETEQHQKFLEKWYEIMGGALLFILGVGGSVFTFLNISSRKDIEAVVKARIRAIADEAIEKELSSFRSQMEKTRSDIEKQVKGLQDTYKGDFDDIAKLVAVLARACAILSFTSDTAAEKESNNQERRDVIQLLKELKKQWPKNRTIAVFIGRLYKALEDYDAAVETLNDSIKSRNPNGIKMQNDLDYSDLWFNKACYLNLKANGQTGAEMEKTRGEAWEALKEAGRAWPHNLEGADKDPDLVKLFSGGRTLEELKRQIQ